jgi:hypothetical protein
MKNEDIFQKINKHRKSENTKFIFNWFIGKLPCFV